MTENRPTAGRPTEGRWLTYGDAAQLFGISTEALRSLARRNQWDRRSPNAVGGQSWVMVPADRLPTGGSRAVDHRLSTAEVRVRPTQRPVPTGGPEGTDQRSDPETERSTNW